MIKKKCVIEGCKRSLWSRMDSMDVLCFKHRSKSVKVPKVKFVKTKKAEPEKKERKKK
jgi:hypothetical protein